MKLKVHRVRFIEYKPQAIHCLAFEDVKVKPRLAVSRADSSIEIWSSKNEWYQQLIIPGCDGTSVESFVWCGNRLFSAGLHGEITEWDLSRLAPKMSVSSLGGAVWSLAVNHSKDLIAAGCEDGCVRLFDITPSGLQYSRSLDKQESRILSLSWHVSDKVIVTGSSDSTVKLYNLKTGHCTMRITMEEFQSRDTLIWDVYIMSDYTIITGDSLGNTQFWDGKLGTLIESYKAHKADVLSLCINEEEDTVFSAGVDSKIVRFKLTKKGQTKKWIKTNSNRVHTHDVRALAMNESKNLLVSGGVDTKLAEYSLSKFESNPKLVPPFPHKPFISVATKANIIMNQCQRSLQFWKLGQTEVESTVIQKPPSQLLQIKAKGDNHIMCSAITSCSSWVAFSDINHVSLFKVNLLPEDATKFQVSRILPLPPDLLPAQKMVFTHDSLKLICATNQHSIQVLEIGEEVALASTIHLPANNENDLPAMCLLAVSNDAQWLACVDSRNAVNVIDINNYKIHSTLPTFSSHITAMAFQPETQCLAIVCSDKQIFMYNTKTSKLTDWSKQAAAQGLPKEWVQRHHKIVGISFDPSCSDLMILQDHEIFTVIDLREPLPEPDVVLFEKMAKHEECRKRPFKSDFQDKNWKAKKTAKLDIPEKEDKQKTKKEKQQKGKKNPEKNPEEKPETNELKSFKVCNKYKPLLYTNFSGDGSLIVVERPWLSILETLPPTLQRKRYGKT